MLTEPPCKGKVLFVTSDKYPCFRPAARAIFGEELPERGYAIDWLLQSDERRAMNESGDRWRTIHAANGSMYIAPTHSGKSRHHRLLKHAYDLLNDLRIPRLTRKNHYDIIQVKDKYLSALIGLAVSRLYKTKFFYWIAFPHGEASLLEAREGRARYKLFYRIRGWFMRIVLYRIITRAADHVFVQSEQMKKDFMNEGVPAHKMTAVPGSLDLSHIPYHSPSIDVNHNESEGVKIILYLGTLNRMRRLDFLIRVFSIVKAHNHQAVLYMIGGGDSPEDLESLKREADRLNIAKDIRFTGHIPMEQAWEYIRKAHVCLSPYFPTPILLSTSPTKLIEYMAMGRPVVGNDHPEQRLLIDESRAGLCVPWEEEAFANAIIEILSDSEKAEIMGSLGRSYVEQHRTNKIMSDVVEHQYVAALNTHGKQNGNVLRTNTDDVSR